MNSTCSCVKEWVAALPDIPGDTDLNQPEPQDRTQDLDNLSLGAEGTIVILYKYLKDKLDEKNKSFLDFHLLNNISNT